MTTNQQPNPWPNEEDWTRLRAGISEGGAEYERLLAAQRVVQNQLSGATPPPEVAAKLADALQAVSDLLAQHQSDEAGRWDGGHPEIPGRGAPLSPPYVIDERTPTRWRGRVTFGRFYLGGNGAAHGGSQPLLFDDLLGGLANVQMSLPARTAYLKVNYRRITPIGVELTFEVNLDRIEGRKRWLTGQLYTPDGKIACDAESLFVELRPGQP